LNEPFNHSHQQLKRKIMAVNSLTKLVFASAFLASTVALPVIASAQDGIASVYSGERTAKGEYASAGGLTAAHKSLPFGTRVRVTNHQTGRSVVVRINDRGPFVRGRIIDLTPAGARALGMDGLAHVSVEVLGGKS
jgi:rare lipoprotein A